MEFPRSKFGWTLAALYLVLAAASWFKALFASDGIGFESLGYILLPAFPWIYLFQFIPDGFFIGVLLYAIFIILNAAIFYWIGVGIQKLFKKRT